MSPIVGGALAGLAVGYALRRGNLCFHSTVRGLYTGSYALAVAWAVAVAIGVVGLTAIYELGPWDGLNTGLAFRPVANTGGGIIFGVGKPRLGGNRRVTRLSDVDMSSLFTHELTVCS